MSPFKSILHTLNLGGYMKNKNAFSTALLVGSIAFSGASFAGGASSAALSYTCAGCHGTNGASNGPATPSLAGMSEAFITDSMVAFRDGERPNTIMTRIAKGYDDDDYAKMGQFFASQKRHTANQSAGGMASKGKKLHKKYCEKCHEDAGTNASDDSGLLSGQWTPYLKYSLADALDGSRDNGKKMLKKLKALHKKEGDKGLQAVLDFYAQN